MGGIAIKIEECNFSLHNLGRITIANAPIEGLTITQKGITYSGYSLKLSVQYTPSTTVQKGVVWSVESGATYATINSDGLLTINSSADGSTVVVKAVSRYDNSIYDTATLTLTYVAPILHSINNTLNNASTSNDAVSVVDGGEYEATITADTGYQINNIVVTMGGVDITDEVVSISSNIFARNSASVSIPSVGGDVSIYCSAAEAYTFSVSNGDFRMGNINSSNTKSTSTRFVHLNQIIPVTQGKVVNITFPPTRYSNYTTAGNDSKWHYKIFELSTTDISSLPNTITSLIQGSPAYKTAEIEANKYTEATYTIGEELTQGIYIQFNIFNTIDVIGGNTGTYNTILSSSNAVGWGLDFTNHGDPCMMVTVEDGSNQVNE